MDTSKMYTPCLWEVLVPLICFIRRQYLRTSYIDLNGNLHEGSNLDFSNKDHKKGVGDILRLPEVLIKDKKFRESLNM